MRDASDGASARSAAALSKGLGFVNDCCVHNGERSRLSGPDEVEDVREAIRCSYRRHIERDNDHQIVKRSTSPAQMTYLGEGKGRVERPPLRPGRAKRR